MRCNGLGQVTLLVSMLDGFLDFILLGDQFDWARYAVFPPLLQNFIDSAMVDGALIRL